MAKLVYVFAAHHPTAEGHFPGNPVIPGAMLLSETLRAIENRIGIPLTPCEIRSAKFFNPARPGDSVQIEFSYTGADQVELSCKVGERPVLTSVVKCAGKPTAG